MKITRKKIRRIINESINDSINEILDPVSLGIGALGGIAAVTLAPKVIPWIKKIYNDITDPTGEKAAERIEEEAMAAKFRMQRKKNPGDAKYLDLVMDEILSDYNAFVNAMYDVHPEHFNTLIILFINTIRSSRTSLATLDPNFLLKEGRLLSKYEFYCFLKGDIDPSTALDLYHATNNNHQHIGSDEIVKLGLEEHPGTKKYGSGYRNMINVTFKGIADLARYITMYQSKKESDPILIDPTELMTTDEKAASFVRKNKKRIKAKIRQRQRNL